MTEEVLDTKPIVPDAPAPEQTPVPETEYTPLEQEMMEQGWRPKAEFDGPEEEFVSAAEYKRRGELFKKIADTNRRLDKANQALVQLTEHQRKSYQAGYEHALKQLRADHLVAVEAGDVKMADTIVDKIEETKAAQAKAAAMPQVPPEPPAVLGEFMDRNKSWYQKDDVMTAYADRVGHQYAVSTIEAGGKPDFADILTHVEKKVREKFPSSFGPKRTAPSVVEGSSTPNRPAPSSRGFELTDMEQKAMRTFVDAGVMTKEEYINDIKKIRGIK